jgi:hypothetical protein
MTEQEQKAWEELVAFTRMTDHPVEFFPPHYHGEDGWEPRYDAAILATDSRIKQLEEAVEWAQKIMVHDADPCPCPLCEMIRRAGKEG